MMLELHGLAEILDTVRSDPKRLSEARTRLADFVTAYKCSDEVRLQVLDPTDAGAIEPGDPPERPAMWSTKQLRPQDHGGPWIASNGRWFVQEQSDGTWRLERRFGGRWRQETDGSWSAIVPPLLTLSVNQDFRTNWEALWLALEIDFWEEIAPEDFQQADPTIIQRIKRLGPTPVEYSFEDVPRYVTIIDDDGDEDTYLIAAAPSRDSPFRALHPSTPLHRAIRHAGAGNMVRVEASAPYNVTVSRIDSLPPLRN